MLETAQQIRTLLERTHRIAIVGMSANPDRPSHYVARYMQHHGFEIIPVNPGQTEIAGLTCYPNLTEVPLPIDMVNVFRRPEHVASITEDTIAIGAKSLWLQLDVIDNTSASRAEHAGLDVVMDRCLKIEHAALYKPDW